MVARPYMFSQVAVVLSARCEVCEGCASVNFEDEGNGGEALVYLLAALALLLPAALLVSVVTGRVRIRACCSADPTKDLRMRAALEDSSPSVAPPHRSSG